MGIELWQETRADNCVQWKTLIHQGQLLFHTEPCGIFQIPFFYASLKIRTFLSFSQ